MQKVYRTKLPADELEIWAETLKGYSFQEFDKAMTHLIANPPKYELEDGSIQVWRGMPKLPDVVDVMRNFRDKAAAAIRESESEKRRKEFAELEKRRAEHPEEFFTLADVLKQAQLPEVKQIVKEWPQEPREQSEADYSRRQRELEQQKENLLKKFS